MDERKYVEDGDKKDDSPMDTDSSDSSSSSAGYTSELQKLLSRRVPLLKDIVTPVSNIRLSSPSKPLQQNFNNPSSLLSHKGSTSVKPSTSRDPPNEMSAAMDFSKMQTSPDRSETEKPLSTRDKQPPELRIRHGTVLQTLLTANPPNESSAAKNSIMQTSPEVHGTYILDEANNRQIAENKQAATPSILASCRDYFSAEVKSSTLFGVPQSCEGICSPLKPRSERNPIYACKAQILLQSVLKEIIQYRAENECWGRLASQFLDNPESSTKKCESNLEEYLLGHLLAMDTDLPQKWGQNMQSTREMAIETYTMGAFEMLSSSVFTALTLLKTLRLSCDFKGFILTYVSFKGLYDTFPHYWRTNNIEAIEDEASRNRLKTLKQLVHRLLVVAVTAFRLFFMYIGENAEEEKMVEYEKYLTDDDKSHLRRENLTLKTFKN